MSDTAEQEILIGKVHFTINFDWLTDYIRSLWSEGSYTLALATLESCEIEGAEARRIIMGQRRMAQDPDGEIGVAGMVIDDTWTPDLSACWLGYYPDPRDTTHFKTIERYGAKYLEDKKSEILILINALAETTYYFDKVRIYEQLEVIPDEVYSFLGFKRPERVQKTFRNPVGFNIDLDSYLSRQLEMDKTTKESLHPQPHARTGIMSPDGDLYACKYNEHRWLIELLGLGSQDEAELAGWIVFSYSLMAVNELIVIFGPERPTPKQIDALMEWATFYKLDTAALMTAINDGDLVFIGTTTVEGSG